MPKTSKSNDCETPFYRVRHTFIADEKIGLGDVIKRASSYVGIKPCAGCEHRAAALNSWVSFTGRTK
jgi:hypothetical protein